MSHTILEDVAILKNKFPDRVHFILGNHELAELTDFPIQKNKQLLNLLFRLGLQQMYGPATEKIREAYLPFVQSCPLAVRLPTESSYHTAFRKIATHKASTSTFSTAK